MSWRYYLYTKAHLTNNVCYTCLVPKSLLYTNIDLTLQNKSHGPTHYKIDDTCVFNGHEIYTLL